ncbi:hypothetical protein HMPREF1981_02044 [Bacteroides pyogenes F0041]|uniref:Lipoprotein n=1 Tax=Bacteroides pyogenes F0041 TaxID=1321819 RepID=U2DU51_9BACE|nr:hypothetical protein [Bacteroides pyogenes]ERI85157.1 hypothetical protein HMPREF1981_02044 [Bacteroides pyogenes F0041]
MKKIFFTLVSIFLLACCTNVHNGKVNSGIKETNIQVFLNSCLESNPNARNNEITRGMLADTIRTRLQAQIGDTLAILSGLTFDFEMCLEYHRRFNTFESDIDRNAGKYAVKFSTSNFNNESISSDKFNVTLQVLTVMNKEDVANLKDNGKYQIQGTFVDFANNSEETGFLLPSGGYFIDYPSVFMDSLDEEKMIINLGTIILDNIKLKPM